MYTGGDANRFLGMWSVDSSRRNTVARVLPGHGKIVKHWPVGGYKRFGVFENNRLKTTTHLGQFRKSTV